MGTMSVKNLGFLKSGACVEDNSTEKVSRPKQKADTVILLHGLQSEEVMKMGKKKKIAQNRMMILLL